MRYHNITKDDMLNGSGLRVVLWVAGCAHHCPGCQNPITHDPNGGIPFDEDAEKELFEDLNNSYTSGLTFSGGDPLHPFNRSEVFRLIEKCRHDFPDKTIWLYTGYEWEEVCHIKGIENIDVICVGEFKQELNDNNIHWVGSSNQRVIDVKKTLEKGEVVLHEKATV